MRRWTDGWVCVVYSAYSGPIEEQALEEIEIKIRDILVSQLEIDPSIISDADSSTPLLGMGIGLDSVESLGLVSSLEKTFDIEVEDAEFTTELFHSIGTLADFIRSKIASRRGVL